MKAIVAIDKLWGIGKDGNLLFNNKEDMKFFKETTIGKVVVMGRKTFESLPNGPLKDRMNLVITNRDYENDKNVKFGDIDTINEIIKKYDTNDIFIIGGASIYEQFLYRCDTVYVTHNSKAYDADTYMPNLAFEGFIPKQITNIQSDSDEYIRIEEWITSESEPYRSVLWFNNSDDGVLFLYANDLYHWKGAYTNNPYNFTNESKDLFRQMIPEYIEFEVFDCNQYYRSEINIKKDGCVLRLASFGDTDTNAINNLKSTILSIFN